LVTKPPKVTVICRVCRKLAAKVETELLVFGKVIHPDHFQQECRFGLGANTIDSLDAFVIFMPCLEEPIGHFLSYAAYLFLLTFLF
jgi:hypothetical protein